MACKPFLPSWSASLPCSELTWCANFIVCNSPINLFSSSHFLPVVTVLPSQNPAHTVLSFPVFPVSSQFQPYVYVFIHVCWVLHVMRNKNPILFTFFVHTLLYQHCSLKRLSKISHLWICRFISELCILLHLLLCLLEDSPMLFWLLWFYNIF